MSYKRLLETRKNILSSYEFAGSYDFWTTLVCLDSIDENKIEKVKDIYSKYEVEFKVAKNIPVDDFREIVDVFTLARHEYTHYIDCTSTIWGLKYLTAMSAAYSCNTDIYKNTDEENYHFAKSFHDSLRFIRLPKYFTELGPANGQDYDWHYTESIGNRFTKDGMVSDYPVLFMRFLDNSGKLIVRSPVSILSILECSAMSQEIQFKLQALQSRMQFIEYKIELNIYESYLKKYLYNKSITEYSACAHLVASKLNIASVFEVFEICSIICRFVLNATDEIYNLIVKKNQIAGILNIPAEHPFAEKFHKGMTYHEPGFLFYLLCRALQKDKNLHLSVDSLYKALNLMGVSKDECDRSYKKEIKDKEELVKLFPQQTLKHTGERGISNAKIIDAQSPSLSFEKLDLPPVYLGNGTMYNFFESNNSNLNNLDFIYQELYIGQRWVERFVEAC